MKLILLGLLLPILSWGNTCEHKGPNLIFFTWDGVRTSDLFQEKNFPNLWHKSSPQGMILGGGNRMRIASDIAVSLPSYQAMMAGKATPCRKNNCGPIKVTTVLEDLRQKLNLSLRDVAVFASWDKIIEAAAKDPSQITHGVFPQIFDDGTGDEFMLQIQKQAMEDLPKWKGSRKDKYTFELARHYLKKHCPRVLWISLVDADEFGHDGDFPGYKSALKNYDQYLQTLLQDVSGMGSYGEHTTLIVTTDHSRGVGPFWKGHGFTHSSEKKVFLLAFGRGVVEYGRQRTRGTHHMLRPTFEALMGLAPNGAILPGLQIPQ